MTGRPRYGFAPALLAVLTAGAPAAAQEGSQDLVAYLTGTWDVQVTFTLPDGSEGTGSATCEAVPIMDGAFLQQEYRSTFGGSRW